MVPENCLRLARPELPASLRFLVRPFTRPRNRRPRSVAHGSRRDYSHYHIKNSHLAVLALEPLRASTEIPKTRVHRHLTPSRAPRMGGYGRGSDNLEMCLFAESLFDSSHPLQARLISFYRFGKLVRLPRANVPQSPDSLDWAVLSPERDGIVMQ